jgi:uncharacterized membrane protein YoaK (UPF0700 family)
MKFIHMRNFPALALAGGMAFLAGATDVYGFVELRGLYVSFMSGNTTMLGMSLGSLGLARSANIALLIGLFVFGAAAGEILSNVSGRFRTLAVILAASMLLCLPLAVPGLTAFAFVAAMGALNAAMTKISGASVSLTYVTGALIKFGQGIGDWLTGRSADLSWLLQSLMWASLLAGSCAAAGMHQIGFARPWPLPIVGLLLAAGALHEAVMFRSRPQP